MGATPRTSTTLLRDLADGEQHDRWGEFISRYRPMMEAFMHRVFPSIDADEAIQETFIALIGIFPSYRYVPEEKGSFHCYLTGVLRHKALRMMEHERRLENRRKTFTEERANESGAQSAASREDSDMAWRKAIFEIALQQYLADDTVQPRTKQIFVRLAVNGEKPEIVASAFGLSRNAVDQIRSRAMRSLRMRVMALEKVENAALGHG